MRGKSSDRKADGLVRRFAKACARREALLEACSRATAELLDAAQHVGRIESMDAYSIDRFAKVRAVERPTIPIYSSRVQLAAWLRDLAAVSAAIRALRRQLQPTNQPTNQPTEVRELPYRTT